MTRALIPTDYQRTRVLGFSVTDAWWAAFYAAIPNPSAWELLWYSGGSVDIWADPNNDCWLGNHSGSGALINGVGGATDPTANPTSIDRVILNVSGLAAGSTDPVTGGARPNLGITGSTTGFPVGGYTNDTTIWRAYIAAAIANIRAKYTSVRMIILQPLVGGPSFGQCSAGGDSNAQPSNVIRCTYHHPFVYTACMSLCKGNVRMGYVPQASSCADFTDWAGHTSVGFDSVVGAAIAAYYTSNL